MGKELWGVVLFGKEATSVGIFGCGFMGSLAEMVAVAERIASMAHASSRFSPCCSIH